MVRMKNIENDRKTYTNSKGGKENSVVARGGSGAACLCVRNKFRAKWGGGAGGRYHYSNHCIDCEPLKSRIHLCILRITVPGT